MRKALNLPKRGTLSWDYLMADCAMVLKHVDEGPVLLADFYLQRKLIERYVPQGSSDNTRNAAECFLVCRFRPG